LSLFQSTEKKKNRNILFSTFTRCTRER
jgi:hypothetical protein